MKAPANAGDDTLLQIYRSTRGYCHGCRRKLAFTGYARVATRGAWDIDAHSLRPACCACLSGHVFKVSERVTARPVSVAPVVVTPTTGCRHTLLGGLLGAFVLGPWGALLGGLLGAELDGDRQ